VARELKARAAPNRKCRKGEKMLVCEGQLLGWLGNGSKLEDMVGKGKHCRKGADG